MKRYWTIEGFWKDDRTSIPNGSIVTNYNDGHEDDDIFYYGLSEEGIQGSISDHATKDEGDGLEFVITAYEELQGYLPDSEVRDLQFIYRKDERFAKETNRRKWVINNMPYVISSTSNYRELRESAFRTIEALSEIYRGEGYSLSQYEEFYSYLYSEDLYSALRYGDDYNKVLLGLYVSFQDQVPNGLRKLDRFVEFKNQVI